MRGFITKRSKNSYSIAISLGKDPATGKYKQQWVSIKGTKREAETELAKLLHQLDTGTFMKPGKTAVADFLQRWLADYARPNLSPRGFERYSGIVSKHLIPDLGNIPLTGLRPEHLQKHYAGVLEKGLTAGTVAYHHRVIHKALATAMKWGLVQRNVADSVDIPRDRRPEMQVWDAEEIGRFLEVAKASQYYALFYTALFSGLRRCELLGLCWKDVDFLFGRISVTRGLHHLKDGRYIFTEPKSAKSRRAVALSPSTLLLLKEHRERREAVHAMLGTTLKDDELVFSALDGKPLRPNTVTRAWSMLAAKAGVKAIRLHDARHSHASLMLKQGVHPKVVQERLGHASIQITLDTYSHVAPGLQESAAAGFDELVCPRREKEAAEKLH